MDDRMLMSRNEAAHALNMSLSHFQRHAQPGLPCVRSGQLRLYRRTDLERWVDEEVGADIVPPQAGAHDLAGEHRRFIADCETGVAHNKLGRSYKPNAIVNLDSSLRRLPEETRRKPLDAVGSGELQEVVDGFRREGLSASRVGSVINAVRSLYKWAIDRERALTNPASELRLPAADSRERDRVATPGEFASLLGILATKDALPWALAAYGTARSQEVRALGWPEVDLGEGLLLLAADEAARKPAAALRTVPLVRPLRDRLHAEWVRQGRPSKGKVCPARNESRSGLLSLGQLSKRIAREWEAFDLTPIGLQDSRHTAATWLDHAGVSPKVASVFMGHGSAKRQLGAAPITLRRCTHVLPGELERARDRLDDFLATREAEPGQVPRRP